MDKMERQNVLNFSLRLRSNYEVNMESCGHVFPGQPGLKHSADITGQDFHLFPLLSFFIFFFEIYDVKFHAITMQVLQQENMCTRIVDDLASIGKFHNTFA